MESKIILPLDGMTISETTNIASQTKGKVWGFKVNDLLIDHGLEIVRGLKTFGKVMADPKLYDIPNTMTNSIKKLTNAGADIITVHMEPKYKPPSEYLQKIAGVTILTTMDDNRCEDVYEAPAVEIIEYFKEDAVDLGYGYLVCSGGDLKDLHFNGCYIKKICPGIRPKWAIVKDDDQKRITTPKQAIELGADLLVIGRPITQAKDIIKALDLTNKEIEEALK